MGIALTGRTTRRTAGAVVAVLAALALLIPAGAAHAAPHDCGGAFTMNASCTFIYQSTSLPLSVAGGATAPGFAVVYVEIRDMTGAVLASCFDMAPLFASCQNSTNNIPTQSDLLECNVKGWVTGKYWCGNV